MIGIITNSPTHKLGNTVIKEEDFLTSFNVAYGLMTVPSIDFVLPISYAPYISGTTQISVRDDDWTYSGYVLDKQSDLTNGTVTINTSHIVGLLSKRTLPTNVTAKDKTLVEVFEQVIGYWEDDKENLVNKFAYKVVGDTESKIEYEFSNESLLEFLTKVCEKTQDYYWRIDRHNPYLIEVSKFGDKKELLLSKETYIIAFSDVGENFSEIVNASVVMSDKTDSGASTLTLRDIFHNKEYQDEKFPVITTGKPANSQRHFHYPYILAFAPEQEAEEYAVIDTEGIALEGGELYWGTITNNDIQAVAEDNKELTDEDRLKATQQLYVSAIRRLKNSRRKTVYTATVKPLPKGVVQPGDMVKLLLDDEVMTLGTCSNYYAKVLKENDWFYVTEISDAYSEGNAHVQEVVLSKYLYSVRDTPAT